MTLLQRFTDFITANNLFGANDRLLLAVSGGVDSVVLCELCKQAGYSFTVAHCNFKLRGEESDRDADFVRELGYGEVLVKEFDTAGYAAQHRVSIQEAARALRYEWFGSLGFPTILTAHHLDDNIETMLMHFFRGTGIQGLRGMLPKQGNIVRPLLFARKQELLYFAQENRLNWVEDSSNATDKYTRNYFRHNVLPLVAAAYPEVSNNLAANLRRFADMEILYEQAIELHKKKLCEVKGKELHIPVLKLAKVQPLHTIMYEIIKEYSFTSAQVDEVLGLLNSDSGKFVQSPSFRIIRNRRWLIIAPIETTGGVTVPVDEEDRRIVFDGGELLIEQGGTISSDKNVAVLDKSALEFPLLLRKWKKGDYFYPLGMKKKKKLARFFIDQKLSLTDKEKVWVLESNKKIVWVVGMRIDERFKVVEDRKEVLRLTLK